MRKKMNLYVKEKDKGKRKRKERTRTHDLCCSNVYILQEWSKRFNLYDEVC